ncbi:MAG: hypothetical protein GY769_22935, partial [bacterium]|nr:hypothetical protein [bacterium]
MPFPYYKRLSPAQKAIYRASDRVSEIPLPRPGRLRASVSEIADSLAAERRAELNRACQQLSDDLLAQLDVEALTVKVLSARPSDDWGELQGLYEPAEDGAEARISVWMRTAQKRNVVAFKTFLRTLLHELGHHLDYELLELEDSLHT